MTTNNDTPDELTYTKWVQSLEDGTLLGQVCNNCGHGTATAAAACSQCGSRDLKVVTLPEEGEVYSETKIAVTPPEFDGPYTVAIIQVTDNVHLTAHIAEEVSVGDIVAFQGTLTVADRPAPVFK